jgi:amino acid transporter
MWWALLEMMIARLLLPYLAVAAALAVLRHLYGTWRRWWPRYVARHYGYAPDHRSPRRIDLRGLVPPPWFFVMVAAGAAIGLVMYSMIFLG